MARASMRELFRFRNSILTSKTNLSSPFYSSCASSDTTGTSTSLFQRSFAVLEACQSMRQLFQIQAHFITCGLFHNPFWAGKVLHFSSDFGGDIDYTLLVFRYIHSPDKLCINTVIKAYSKSCVPYQAVVFYFEWLRNGFLPNSYTFVPLVGSCAKMGCVKSGLECHGQAIKNGVDCVTGLRGSDTTMVGVLTACGHSARLKEGRSAHGFLIKMFLRPTIIIDTALIDMYSRCKRVDVACEVFKRMANRNLVCWNAMILGHCLHGNPEDGLTLFGEMLRRTRSKLVETNHGKHLRPDKVEEGIIPDEITFIGVLCACARAGFLTEGRDYFGLMIDVYTIKPNFAHYWCMANLYAKLGLIQKAEEILRNMPEDEDKSSESLQWANLLSSCRFLGDVSLGERIAKSLIDMDPQNPSYYQLLLNVYAVAGQWEDVARVKEMMKDRNVGRMPGCNLIDLKELVHSLKVGDYWQERMEEASMMMDKLKS
ncbi:pentatricopeptide repeat-containing protein [Quercus suber]|uniref:Pentatricopeptide repeat-containing protein n=1 Tax=Quercus suber TaxID=58331 RepID=A0AAW0J0H5_QUESU